MIEVLRNKNLTTRLQILVEIADKGPDVQQRDIAHELDITPQAVSDYIAQLVKDGMLVSEGRSSYRVTNEGVNWVIQALKELGGYTLFIQRAINNISVCAAIAEGALRANQRVGLVMKEGVLVASAELHNGASAVTIAAAQPGQDVGVGNIRGIVPLDLGAVTILRIPNIERGGSRNVDYRVLKANAKQCRPVTALGLESGVALKRAGVEFCRYGAVAIAVESARSGLNPLVVCIENETSELINKLEKEKLRYRLIDAEKA